MNLRGWLGIFILSGSLLTGAACKPKLNRELSNLSESTIEAVATQLVFSTQPSSSNTAGASFVTDPKVTVLDSNGNPFTSSSASITVSIGNNPSGGTLSGTLTVEAINGVATFSGLSINLAGSSYTLTAAATGLTGATSSAFNITPGVATKLAFSAQPSNTVSAASINPAVQVTLQDAQGNAVTSAIDSITIAIGTNPSGGTLSGTTSVAAVSGVASFSTLNINKSGTGYTLTAAATGLTGSTSSAFNITPGAATKLAFSAQPSNTVSAASISPAVQVTLQDAQGNTVTSATDSITIAIGTNPSGGALSGTNSVAAVSGVASFSTLNINKSGTGYTLTATATGLTGATSSTFNITVGAAAKLAFTVQPSTTVATSSISPAIQVTIQDAQSNTVTSATDSITIAIGTNPSGGTLSGTTSVAAVSGVASFSNLSINTGGSGYTLTAAATGLTGSTSSAFNIDYLQTWTATTTTGAPSARIYHTVIWTGSKMIVWGGYIGASAVVSNTGGQYDPVTNSWSATTTTGAPDARSQHTAVWTGSKMIVWGGGANTGGQYNPVSDSWSATTTTGAPTARYYNTAIWTGSQMIIWGGNFGGTIYNSGGQYDPVSDSWSATSTTGAPSARRYFSTIWTGSKMIVWGGFYDSSNYWNTGGQYNPIANSWNSTTTSGAPSARVNHTAVWTGSKMIIWGGSYNSTSYNTGNQYDPNTNSWSATSTSGAPSVRSLHTAVWTGAKMIVWGGISPVNNTGGLYDPITDTWIATTTNNAPDARYYHTAIWTGSKMIAWGGYQGTNGLNFNTGGILDIGGQQASDTWVATTTTGVPLVRRNFSTVWTGTKIIVWGGTNGVSTQLQTGGQFDPIANSWTPTSTTGAPSVREAHSAVWTGSKMIAWGGSSLNSGGLYDPVTDAWTDMTTTGAPTPRDWHSAIWTGSKMIVWSGSGGSNTGGIYDPIANSWTATTTTGAPSTRRYFSAIWTGSKMIVWGGEGGGPQNTGGQYDPAANSWTATTTTGAPTARMSHSLIWTGTKMIVYGGQDYSGDFNNGGKYDPVLDSWSSISTTGAPVAKYGHSAVWTGAKMIVWGGDSGGSPNTGGIYDPIADSWTPTNTTGAPTARWGHTAIWTGYVGDSRGSAFQYNLNNNGDTGKMIIWGGNDGADTNTGGIYQP